MIEQIEIRIKELEQKITLTRSTIDRVYADRFAEAFDASDRRALENKKTKEIYLATRDDVRTLQINKDALNALIQSFKHGYH